MKTIASEQLFFTSPDPAGIYCYTPAICAGFGGRILAGFDLGGPGTAALEGPRSASGDYETGNQVRLYRSDDHGASWVECARLAMRHQMLFRAGSRLYALGNDTRLVISSSADNGESWSEPAVLDDTLRWHQGSCAVDERDGRVYLVYERYLAHEKRWPHIAQFFMSAPVDADLRERKNWTFSPEFNGDALCGAYRGLCDLPDASIAGILETNVVPIAPACGHLAKEPGRNWLLVSRFNSWGLPLAAFLKGTEHPDGSLEIGLFPSRSTGAPFFVVPFPGGGLKFHILYDEVSQLYFLIANQARDVLHEADRELRSNRRMLGLWCAPDCLCWRSLGCVAWGPCEKGARSYAQMMIDGDDLLVISRSGDDRAKSEHDNNLVTLHRVRDFRKLAAEE